MNGEADGFALYVYANLSDAPIVTPLKATAPPMALDDQLPYRLSPDRRFVAVALDGDSIRKPRLQILATDTGKAVLTADVDVEQIYTGSWSPDSTAVLARGLSSDAAVYHIDGTVEPLKNFPVFGYWGTGKNGPVFVGGTVGAITTQLVGAKHTSVLLQDMPAANATYENPTVAARVNADTGALTPLPGGYSLAGHLYDRSTCPGQFAVLGRRTPGQTGSVTTVDHAIFDANSGKLVPVHMPFTATGCPVASNGGGKAAFVSATGVSVVDLTSGKETTIARNGRPVAWSKDDSQVLVVGSAGVFLVAADGSGGKKASTSLGRFCPLGDTGKVLYATGVNQGLVHEDVFIYDLSTDSATKIGSGVFTGTQPCEVSGDGHWAVTGSLVVDIAGGHATTWAPPDANGRTIAMTVHLRGAAFTVTQDSPN